MSIEALIAFSLASAIGAELLLFAVFLLSRSQRSAALSLLAGLSLLLAGIVIANLAIGVGAWPGLANVVLFADLCIPPMAYLYVRQLDPARPPPNRRDVSHVAPAVLGTSVWVANLVSSMDTYVIGCWVLYLGACVYRLAQDGNGYTRARRRFIVVLLGVLSLVVLLRGAMSFNAGSVSFLNGTPYLLVLLVTFAATCLLLFSALRFPDLMDGPAGKYLNSPIPETELIVLEARLLEHIKERRPYLDPDLTLTALAAQIEAPGRQVSQLVNARFGLNVSAYLNRCRIEEAARLLAAMPATPIKLVMFQSGFRSKSIFNREFQRRLGVSPSIFKRRHFDR